jgi:hypothetical protein
MRGKPAGGNGCHGMVQRIEMPHAGKSIGHGAQDGDADVNGHEGAGEACELGKGLVAGIG